ncbi:MAG: hypothetical protein NC821_05055, partial [Candidatus Omnitrophica bacterium]|nr:hypothetical protein [Candidatus Omnitrophota bacterium]
MIFLILSLLTLLSQIDSNPTQQKKQRRETEPISLQRIPFSNRALSDLDHILDSVGIDRNRVIYKVKSISDTGDVIKVVPARQGPHYPTNELRSKDQLTIFLSVPKSELSPFIEAYQREKEKSSGEIEARIEGKNILCPRDLLIPYISQETKEDTGTVNLSNLDIREYPLRKLDSILDSCKIFNRKLVVRKIMKKEDEIRVVSKNPYSPKEDEMRRNETLTIYLLLPESKLRPFLEGYENIPPEMQGSTKEIKAEVENETLYCPIKLLKPYLPKSSEERIEGYIGKFLFILLFLGGLVVLSLVAMLILLPKNLGSAISKAFWGEEKEKKKEEGEEREIKGLEGIQRQLGLLRDFVKVGAQKVGEKWEKFPQEIESVLSSKRDGIIKETTKQVLENESLLERIREMIKEEKRKEPPIEVTQIPLLEAYNRTLQSKDKTLQEEFIKSRDAVRVSPEGERAEKGYLAPKDADYLFRKDPNGTFLIIEERGDFFAFPDFNTDITTSSAVISAFNINVAELADSKNWGVISPAKAEKIEGGLWRLIKMGEIGRTQISPEERVIKKINEIEEKFTKEVEIIKNEIDLLEKRKEEIKEIIRKNFSLSILEINYEFQDKISLDWVTSYGVYLRSEIPPHKDKEISLLG